MVSALLDRKLRREIARRTEKAKRKGRMKTIVYDDKFRSANGQPFYIPDPDVKVQREAREQALKEGKTAYEIPQVEATFASLVIWFVDNIPHERNEQDKPTRKITISDAGNAYSVIKSFRALEDGKVELEDAVHKWLVDTIDMDGTAALRGSTAAVLKERILSIAQT